MMKNETHEIYAEKRIVEAGEYVIYNIFSYCNIHLTYLTFIDSYKII
jgi:hypothetical protein